MAKLRISKAYLYRTKGNAVKKAKSLRKNCFRATVKPSNKTTRKRSPHLKWAVFQGQKRKGC